MTIQASGGDVPEHCPKCKQTTLFRPDAQGTYHCLRCLAGAMSSPGPAPSSVNVTVKQPAKGGGIMIGTIKLAGFIAALIFFLILGCCVYCAGQMGEVTSKVASSSSRCKPGQWPLAIETDAGRARQRWVVDANTVTTGGHLNAMGCDAVILFVQVKTGDCTNSDLAGIDKSGHDTLIGLGFTTLACAASGPRLDLR